MKAGQAPDLCHDDFRWALEWARKWVVERATLRALAGCGVGFVGLGTEGLAWKVIV